MGHALDALRVASTLVVILYHAALSYVATPLRLTLWVAYDRSGHVAFDAFVYWVNGFVMPVFFLAAGVSAPAACESRGPRTFLAHRASRLLRPLLFGCLTVLPIFYLIWGYGLMATGRCDMTNIMAWRFDPPIRQNLYGLGHLWFLEYLFLVCVLWCVGWWLRGLLPLGTGPAGAEGGWARRVLDSPWRPLLLAIPTAAIFCADSDTMLRVDNVIVPNAFRLLHYLLFFTVGGWISKVREPRRQFARYGLLYLGLSLVVFALMLPLLLRHAAAPLQGWSRVGFCVLAALFPWLTVFGGLGSLLRVVRGRGGAMRFLSEASFWVYIVHVPIVALVQVLLLPFAWPGAIKFLVVSAVAVALSLLSYGPVVRHSLVGEIINGARKRAPRRPRLGPEFGWVATLGVLMLAVAGAAWHFRVFFWGHNGHEVIPGQLYRSARLEPGDLDRLIRREGLRTVVTITGGGVQHPWFAGQKRVCRAHRVELRTIYFPADQAPSRHTLIHLMDILERCPRPILVQGYRGFDQVGFAAALGQLLGGSPPRVALRQFGMQYGQVGGPEHSPLGLALLDYQDWLDAHRWPHSAQRLQTWAREGDLAHPGGRMARGGRGATLAR
jgi:glucans biosynthesis protein C